MCDCIKTVNEALREHNTTLVFTLLGAPNRVCVAAERIENRRDRKKAAAVVATFCPFCGEKYAAPLMAGQRQEASGHAHTPGPWSVEPPYTTGGVCFEGYAPISAATWGELAKVAVEVDRQHSDEGEANARLIAAAPAMYNALLRLRATLRLAKTPHTAREWDLQGVAENLETIANGAICEAGGR
jgi:hypothetical protein